MRRLGDALLFAAMAVVLVLAGWTVVRHPQPAQAQAAAPVSVISPPPVRTAIFFGDSYFNGANGVSVNDAYAALTGHRLGYDVTFIEGHGGTGFARTEAAAPHTPPYAEQIKDGELDNIDPSLVRLVVLEGGLNDEGLPPDQVQSAAANLLGFFQRTYPKAKVVLVGPVSPNGSLTDRRRGIVDALRSAAGASKVPFVDETPWVTAANRARIIGPDGTHPTAAGHEILATKLTAALRTLGAAA